MRRLPVDLGQLELAMEMRSDFQEGEQYTCLDVQTGELLWVWESDDVFANVMNEDPSVNARCRERVHAEPERFIVVPEYEPADAHDALRSFLASDWTDDDAQHEAARRAYRGSIRRWKDAMGRNSSAVHAWHRYEEQACHQRALAFLASHGIEPIDTPSR